MLTKTVSLHNSNVNSYQAANTIIPVTDISCNVTDAHFALVTAYQAADIIRIVSATNTSRGIAVAHRSVVKSYQAANARSFNPENE